MSQPKAAHMARRAVNQQTFPSPVLILVEHNPITDSWSLLLESSKSIVKSTLTYIDATHAMYQFSDAFKSNYRLVHSRYALEQESRDTGNLLGIQLIDPGRTTPGPPAAERKRASQQLRKHEPPDFHDGLLKQEPTNIFMLNVIEPKCGGE
jgi:hypothetical protein